MDNDYVPKIINERRTVSTIIDDILNYKNL